MKIVIGGQIDKEEIYNLVVKGCPGASVEIKSDLDAAMALQQNKVDYYIGACNTGGGGALAMALALVGADKCVTVSMPGSVMSENEIIENVKSGKKAFGFTAQDKEFVLEILCRELNNIKG